MTVTVPAYGTEAEDKPLGPMIIPRRTLGPKDIRIDIEFCGICHTDIHYARNDWGTNVYPLVPGHEIVGRVAETGAEVTRHAVGDRVGVGCMVDSCRTCAPCVSGEEQFCTNGFTATYGRADPKMEGHWTYGGYSTMIVVDEAFVVRVPESLDPAGVAPLLCAGITTYSPLAHWGVKPGWKVGVIGLGGLGHMGVKIAVAMGAQVTMITTSPEKGADAMRLGADEILISSDADAMAAAASTFDFLLNTIPVSHDLTPYAVLLKPDCAMVIVGSITPVEVSGRSLFPRRHISGSLIGGIAETQEMLDFCGEHGITSDIELIRADAINPAWDRVVKGDVKYRFVIDCASLKT
ncbi:MAG: NAD(P)-dependent alcohol dehydrogenase [Pseudomonadota bacterium]